MKFHTGASLLSSKFNISFNVDLEHIAPEMSPNFTTELAGQVFVDLIFNASRKQLKGELSEIHNSTAIQDSDVKAIKMAEKLRGMMLGIMAEANLEITELPANTVIKTDLPFEIKYRDGEAA